ncbi:MAG: phosphoribosylamine--glycine ligase [Actinobacteria bacterium]|nr:phosphoribosylamine--glycine ligase [Actinomycetota bacterium]
MRVLLVGSGGREHALAWKLAQSPSLDELHAAPGNPAIAALGVCHPVRAEDPETLLGLARALTIDLVVIGPETPLVLGVADALRKAGIPVFGPSRAAARIEGSKTFAKEVMRAAGVPTAGTMAVARAPCVVKADGLAAGKGVFVCRTSDELDAAVRAAAGFRGALVIEELLEGEEVSLFALCDGRRAVPFEPAQDFKRLADGDRGPNTGGMGSCAPAVISPYELEELVGMVHQPVLDELARRGTPFVGLLYAGLMLTPTGPHVLEFNCRFGDPETQSLLPRLVGDVLPPLAAAAAGDLGDARLDTEPGAAVTVVLAGGRYPLAADSGTTISGVEEAEKTGARVFHAGTALQNGRLVTNGGRVLNVTATAGTVAEARSHAYAAVEKIAFSGMRFRTDIAAASAARAEPVRV